MFKKGEIVVSKKDKKQHKVWNVSKKNGMISFYRVDQYDNIPMVYGSSELYAKDFISLKDYNKRKQLTIWDFEN